MSMAARLPTMPDADLASLRANVVRLLDSGTGKQKTQAEELLPFVEAEVQARIAAKPPKKTPVKRASKAKVKAAPVEAEEAEEEVAEI